MKNTILLTVSFFILSLFTFSRRSIAQSNFFETSTEKDGTKILKGLLQRSDIEQDPSFRWFSQNMKLGQVNAAAVTAFQKNAVKFHVIVFAGTWCEDTHNVLPSFYRLVDKSGYPDSSITLIGVDRAKTTLFSLHTALNVTMTPTFIVLKDGKEIGRVSEYGKYGLIDKELGEIVNTIQ